ncbi:MAG: type II toxin-antitoxin system HicA family toxin [Candidatus Xenobia bacterium]
MKRTEFIRKIQAAGWSFLREGGEHSVYAKKTFRFAVPRHRDISPGVVRQWERLNEEADKS